MFEDTIKTRITELFSIRYPIIQGGMIWVATPSLASAVSNAGGLGLLGSGSMRPDELNRAIDEMNSMTDKPWGVNIPLTFKYSNEHIGTVIRKGVKIVFTSAGDPSKFTEVLKKAGIKVAHVVSNVKQAKKAESSGVDCVVAEGYEAGGHNGKDEITTMTLIPQVVDAVKIPVIAAGGIADARGMLSAFSLGAEGVQIGTRFAISKESGAHENYKKAVLNAYDSDTIIIMRRILPTRALKNPFSLRIKKAEEEGMKDDELISLHGEGRAMRGIRDGDIEEGEIEVGQIAGLIKDIPSVAEIIERIFEDYKKLKEKLP
ncbi:MAG: NAD(P)H-dependent flavin oxidoreductase [Candidatus Aminicenantia bacterium]